MHSTRSIYVSIYACYRTLISRLSTKDRIKCSFLMKYKLFFIKFSLKPIFQLPGNHSVFMIPSKVKELTKESVKYWFKRKLHETNSFRECSLIMRTVRGRKFIWSDMGNIFVWIVFTYALWCSFKHQIFLITKNK